VSYSAVTGRLPEAHSLRILCFEIPVQRSFLQDLLQSYRSKPLTEHSISFRIALTTAMRVVKGPSMTRLLDSFRSGIIRRVPRVR